MKNLVWHQAFRAAVRALGSHIWAGDEIHKKAAMCADLAVPDGDQVEHVTGLHVRAKRSAELAAELVLHREGLEALADNLYGAGERPSLDMPAGEAWALLLNKLADVLTSGLREIEQAEDDAASAHVRADVSSIDDQG